MKRPKSPCISVCIFSGQNDWCLGCGRTRQECKEWKHMKPYARKRMIKELDRRMMIIDNNSQKIRKTQ